MKVLWTPRAALDLDEAVDYIGAKSPDSAVRVAHRIYAELTKLSSLPNIGRVGDVPGTREIVFHPWPYIAVYRIMDDSIRILRIRHASRLWP